MTDERYVPERLGVWPEELGAKLEAERLAKLQQRIDGFTQPLYLFGQGVTPVAVKVGKAPPTYGEFLFEEHLDEVYTTFGAEKRFIGGLHSWRLAVEHDQPVYPGSSVIELTFAQKIETIRREFYHGEGYATRLTPVAEVGQPVVWVAEYLGNGELSKWKI